jgi:hypothetical protein
MTLFQPTKESILVTGLNAMTQANEALQEINRNLSEENKELSAKVANLTERVVTDSIEKE